MFSVDRCDEKRIYAAQPKYNKNDQHATQAHKKNVHRALQTLQHTRGPRASFLFRKECARKLNIKSSSESDNLICSFYMLSLRRVVCLWCFKHNTAVCDCMYVCV